MNPDLRKFIAAPRGPLPSALPLVQWVGRPYKKSECYKFFRDAYQEVAGLKLPESYYEAMAFFTEVPDPRLPRPERFVPEPWDLVAMATFDPLPDLVLHPGIVIDADRWIHTWSDVGPIISRFDDERFASRIRWYARPIPPSPR